MKIFKPSILTIAILIFLSAPKFLFAQSDNYYYNNFDNGVLGSGLTQIGQAAALSVSIPSAANRLSNESGYSLTTTGSGIAGGYDLSFIGNNTNLFNSDFGYEWTLLYRNNGGNTDNANTIDNGENSWKYWLFKDNADQNVAKGYYLTQEGNTLYLRYQGGNSSSPANFSSYAINSNTTYAIRAQFVKRGNQFAIFMYVDAYDGSVNGAKTMRGSIAYEWNQPPRVYQNSSLLVSSTSANRFVFDELKTYSMKLLITGANDASNGISNPMYPGQKDAIFYGLRIDTRGLFDVYQFQLNLSGSNVWSTIETGGNQGKLYKSFDSYYGNADDVFVTNLVVYDTNIQHNGSFNDTFYSVGNDDGSSKTTQYYYITLNIKTTAPSNGSLYVSGATTITSYNSSVNYASNSSAVTGVNTSTNPANSGGVKDWLGTTPNWNVASNWSPSGVPGVNDLARIGVVSFTNNPVVSNNPTVGNIQFGTEKAAELKVDANNTLTVNGRIENLEGISIVGDGTLDVKGIYLAKPTATAKTTTSRIARMNVANFVLGTESSGVTFNFTGANMLIKNAVQTTGANSATFTLGSNSTLTLEGATPFSLLANSNTLNLNNGTVVYAANIQQEVPSFSYKNISFSGTGLKRVASGTLYVSGVWNSAGGKVDLLTNNTSVNFNGANQAISDTGSDTGNGVSFGNLFLNGGVKTLSANGKFNLVVGKYLTLGTNTVFQTSDNFTLKSSVSGSASVAAIPPSASIQGNVTVERYVKGGSKSMWRTYRMFSSPVYDNGNPSNRTYSFTQFIDDMLVTGKSEGFDQLNNSSASAWTYNNGFVAIPDINTSVNVGRGAYLLYRGNRDNPLGKVSTPYVDAESIVMTYKGKLNQQSITVPLEHGSTGFSMLGNPYAATIDWNAIVKTGNVDYVVRIWNPSNRQYATFNGIDGLNGGSRYIGPGQGFFVQTTDGNSPSVTFTEDAKVTSVAQVAPLHNVVMAARSEQAFVEKLAVQNTNTVQTAIAVETPAKVRIKLTRDGYENEDETLVVLKRNEPASFAGYDVARSGGESVFLSSLSSEGSKMGINYMPHISSIQKVALDVNVSNNGDYKMQFALTDVPLGYEIKLNDKYLNTITDVTNEGTVYSLSIDKAVGSSLGDRFELLVGPSTTLPVTLVDFAGDKVNDGVLLKWQTSSEVNNSHFEIQRAGDDRAYITIGSVVANAAGSYNLLDKSPLNGNNYYRLVQIDNNGNQTTFPKLAQVKFDLNGTSGLLVYPTLVQSTFTMKFNGNLSSKQYIVKVADATGKEVYTKGASKEEVYNGFIGELTTMPSGVYFAALLDSTNGNRLGVVKMIKK